MRDAIGFKGSKMVALALGIDFGRGNSKRSFKKSWVKCLQFVSQSFKDADGVLFQAFGDINQKSQQGGSLNMFEKLNAKAFAFMRPFD